MLTGGIKPMEETSLYRNKRKTIQLLSISGALCLLLLLVLLYSIGLFDGVFKAKATVFSAGALLVLLILLFSSLLSLRDKTAQIVLNDRYFLGKTTPVSKAFGRGDWQDVKSIDLQKVGGDTLVVVTLWVIPLNIKSSFRRCYGRWLIKNPRKSCVLCIRPQPLIWSPQSCINFLFLIGKEQK
ncbi:MAG: hypothetical protein ACN6O7_12890 [Sphingobacterium sp.]